MTPIMFFTDDIKIRAHTATEAKHIGKAVSVRDFAQGKPVSLYELENGDVLLRESALPGQPRPQCPRFIEGPQL